MGAIVAPSIATILLSHVVWHVYVVATFLVDEYFLVAVITLVQLLVQFVRVCNSA